MRTEFLESFNKDLESITLKSVKRSVEKLIIHIESSPAIISTPNLKKLSGFKSAYRIRIGDYRVGIFVHGDTVQFARIVHRKDIYKVFP